MDSLSIYTKLETLPNNLKQEVADFVDFLISKSPAQKKKVTKKIVPGFGSAKGKIKMSEDFDAPIEDFKDYM